MRTRSPHLGRCGTRDANPACASGTGKGSISDGTRPSIKDQLLQTYPRAPRSSRAHKTENADPATHARSSRCQPKDRQHKHHITRFPAGKSDMFSLHDVTYIPRIPMPSGRRPRSCSPSSSMAARAQVRTTSTVGSVTQQAGKAAPVRSTLARQTMVEPDGIEPTTSCLQSTRSPN